MRTSSFVWQHRYKFAVGGSLLYSGTLYTSQWLAARKRDQIKDDTLLYLRVFPGSIVSSRLASAALRNYADLV